MMFAVGVATGGGAGVTSVATGGVTEATSCAGGAGNGNDVDDVALAFCFATRRRALDGFHRLLPNGGLSKSMPITSAF